MADPDLREICEEYAGHEWAPMGGGMEICMRCEMEREQPCPADGVGAGDGESSAARWIGLPNQ